MQYAKLIKYPVPTVEIDEYTKLAKEFCKKSASYRYRPLYLYHAEILDSVLAITLYAYKNSKLMLDKRHFYDGTKYATQDIKSNKRLDGSIVSFFQYGNFICIDDADKVITSYFADANTNVQNDNKGIKLLIQAEKEMMANRLAVKHKKITDVIDSRMQLLPENPPKAFYEWINNWVFEYARYFFYNYNKKAREQRGYCSHCKNIFETDKAKNGSKITCPSCKSVLICKSYGRITKYSIVDAAKVSYVEQITEDGKPVLVERFFNVRQEIAQQKQGANKMTKGLHYYEYSRVFLSVDTIKPLADIHGSSKYSYGYFKQTNVMRWCNDNDNFYEEPGWLYPHNLDNIIKQCGIAEIRNVELSAIVPYHKCTFALLCQKTAKLPVLENMSKQGLYNLLDASAKMIGGWNSYYHEMLSKFIDNKQKACNKALGVDKTTVRKFAEINITENAFNLYKNIQNYAVSLKYDTFERYLKLNLENNVRTIAQLLQNHELTPERLISYIEKQAKKQKNGNEAIMLYSDYLSMVKDLRLPKSTSVMFPADVKKEHDRLIKIKADRKYGKQNKMLKKRVKLLEMLDYQDDDYIIRPLRSADEFLTESSVLSHCVKTYIDRCSEGKTNIYGIRKIAEPDTPYFTLTLSNHAQVITNLGKCNCKPTKEVEAFVKKWVRQVVNKKKEEFVKAAAGKPQKVRTA